MRLILNTLIAIGVACAFALPQTQLPSPPNNAPIDNSYGPELDITGSVLYFVQQVAAGGHTYIFYSTQPGGALDAYGPRMIVPDVNNGTDHDAPAITPDNGSMIITRSGGLFRLYLTTANASAAEPWHGWSTPQPLTIGAGTDFGATLLRAPGREHTAHLFLTSTRQGGLHDVYFAAHNGIPGYNPSSWTSPIKLNILPRTPGATIVFEPAVAMLPDGRVEMVYAANTAGGAMRLWRTVNPSSAEGSLSDPSAWSQPEELAFATVGSSTRSPYIDAGNRVLYYEDTIGNNRLLHVADLPIPPCDCPPIADAGVDQSVCEGETVTLDGSGSTDPDGGTLAFTWSQLTGHSVSLDLADPVRPTFPAPLVPAGGTTLTFQLVVHDGTHQSAPSTVNVTVKNVNNPPVAEPGDDKTVSEYSVVPVDGSASFDPDGENITCFWQQLSGPPVMLDDPFACTTSFLAPCVTPPGEQVVLQLAVSDGIDVSTDTVEIFIVNVNQPPTADAGEDQLRDEGACVTLTGTATDPDGDPLTVSWVQLSGVPVMLSDAATLTPTFIAPDVAPGALEDLVFELTVSDGLLSATDTVTVTVRDSNAPPNCSRARASRRVLWPPNHRLVPVRICGVRDPDGDPITVAITSVTQDEPTSGLGCGDTGPDAWICGRWVWLRAERDRNGNGRFYHVSFTATDAHGNSCSGTVKVKVPKRRRRSSPPVDDGPLYDSTQ